MYGIEGLQSFWQFCIPVVFIMKLKDVERPVVDTLTLPIRHQPPLPDSFQQAYWLRLADIALGRARAEQEKIKEQIRPHVERYKQITRNRRSKRKAA